jgi:hypothetical protein
VTGVGYKVLEIMIAGIDTWTPLFSSIVASSIWGQEPHIKVVWITMLAIKRKDGFVAASVPGLARLAAVTPEQCREALRLFEAPDDDSQNGENKGIRIQAMDGGWMILGHERFQKRMKEVSTQVGNAKRQKAFRERKKGLPLPGETSAVKAMADGDEAGADRIVEDSITIRSGSTPIGINDAVKLQLMAAALENGDEVTVGMLERAGIRLPEMEIPEQ